MCKSIRSIVRVTLTTRRFQFSASTSRRLIRHIKPLEILGNWWISPFNGQSRRTYAISVLAHELEPTAVVETGTFVGSSTQFFLGMPTVKKVISIESNLASYKIASTRYKDFSSDRLELLHGDSKVLFSEVLDSPNPKTTTLLCYLDAHWEGDIPTIEELKLLARWEGTWLAVVDDFKIPSEIGGGYGFDQYGDSIVDMSVIPKDCGLRVYIPNDSSENETGAKRGTAYIFGRYLPSSELMFDKLRLKELIL